jgi:hypothetical protein
MRADKNWVTANADSPSRPNKYPTTFDAEKSFLVFDKVTSMRNTNVKGVYESLYFFHSSSYRHFTATAKHFLSGKTLFQFVLKSEAPATSPKVMLDSSLCFTHDGHHSEP